MAELIVGTFLTLDGVMQAPGAPDEDPSGGFEHGGWLVPFADDDMGQIINESMARSSGFLLGRRTYEIFAAYWPHVTDENDPVASALNNLPKYVVSTTLDRAEWNNTTLIKENVAEEIAKLKDQAGDEILVQGSSVLAQTLMRHGLVDEYRLWFYPVILGQGKKLFEAGTVPTSLKLIDTKTTSTGVVLNTYRPAGPVEHGSF